jgi:ribonuclease HI/transposase InsO family protein
VYFISEVLSDTKARYSQIEKLAYALLITRRKLRHYFDAHPITVVSKYPLGEVIRSPEVAGRMAKWAIELMGADITYAPRDAIKSQALADFLAEWTEVEQPAKTDEVEYWTLYFDRSVKKFGAGAGLVFSSPRGVHMKYSIRLHFPASNNVAEYEALVNGLRIASELGIRHIEIKGDSELVKTQVMKEADCVNPKMVAYHQKVRELEEHFSGIELVHVKRNFNDDADVLAKLAADRKPVPPGVFVHDQRAPSIRLKENLVPSSVLGTEEPASTQNDGPTSSSSKECLAASSAPTPMDWDGPPKPPSPDWRLPLLDWLIRGKLPPGKEEARRLARRAKSFAVINGELYRKGASGILQRCIAFEEGEKLVEEIHAGECGHHAAPRALVGKAFRQGFYWPTAVADANRVVRHCKGCQYFAKQTHLPAQALQTIPLTWPFAVWGLDMVGPFKKTTGGYTHLLVAIDKFTKWIEVMPISRIRAEETVKFFTGIIHRFGVPNSIITDNGTNFVGRAFLEFCDDKGIRVDTAAVSHPRTNGQAERANSLILQGIKARIFSRLQKYGKRWLAELPSVVWSLRTTPSRATGRSPFFLVFGSEAVLPTDLEFGAPRVRTFNEEGNQAALQDAADQLDEARDIALLHSAKYLQAMRRFHDRHVKGRAFEVGDHVLRRVQSSKDRHKLSAPWEGPFTIAEVLRPGSYKLKDEQGRTLNNAWNIEQLRRFYP